MNQPLISIIIPAYNHEQYVEQAILSVINQTYKNIELIVIDDQSPDNTPQIIEKLQKQYNFKYIRHEKNQGICKTLNEGLKLAQGEFLSILASDDAMLPERIETCIGYFQTNPDKGLVFSNANKIDIHNNLIQSYYLDINLVNRTILLEKDKLAESLLEANCIPVMSVLVRTKLLREIDGFDESLYFEDWDAWVRLALHGIRFGFINEGLVNYRITPNSMSKTTKFIDAKKTVLLKHQRLPIVRNKLFNALNLEYAKYYIKSGNFLQGIIFLFKFIFRVS